jgi:uncharacterized protein YbcI
MTISHTTIPQQIADAARSFQLQCTGHEPRSVSVVVNDNTVVITLHEALSPAEMKLAETPAGAAQVQEYHRHLFESSAAELWQSIQRITGIAVEEAAVEVKQTNGAVAHTFVSGTMVQVFRLTKGFDEENAVMAGPDADGEQE